MEQVRSRCRNLRCRTKLAIPTDNHHKAFCAPFCHEQFYKRRCLVCEKELPEGHRRQLCSARQCRLDYHNFRPSYTFALPPAPNCQSGARSAHFTGVESAIRAPGKKAFRIIAGPPPSDFSLWAATLDPPPYRPVAGWVSKPPPGTIAAEWTAHELARREADDAQYVAEDEKRLRTEQVDLSGNYAVQA